MSVPPEEVPETLLTVERVRAAFGKGLLPYLTNIINGAVLFWLLGRQVDLERGLIWVIALSVLALARVGLVAAHDRRSGALSPRGWETAFTAGVAANAVLWGASAFVLWSPGQVLGHALLGFVVGGMVAGATASLFTLFPAFVVFAVTALSPLIVRLVVTGNETEVAMGGMLTLFGVAMTLLARRSGRTFTQMTRLRLRNVLLVESLSDARDHLERRVAERTAELERTVGQLSAAEGEAHRAVKARDEFLAIAGHELKTPLATLKLQIQGLECMARRDGLGLEPSVLLGRLEKATGQIERLERLVRELLDVSRITAGRMILEIDDMDLTALIGDVVDRFSEQLDRAGCRISVRAHGPVLGRWDRARLDQVITNLVGNAVKYGPGKPIELAVEGENACALVTVRDHGIGIAVDDRERIFDRFERAVGDRRYGGLGLGLWISRQIVQAHGGRISLDSTPGHGSAFTVELPRHLPQARA